MNGNLFLPPVFSPSSSSPDRAKKQRLDGKGGLAQGPSLRRDTRYQKITAGSGYFWPGGGGCLIAGCRDDQRAPDRSPNENKGSLFFFHPFARAKRGTRAKANRHELHITYSKRRKLQCFPIVSFVCRSLSLSHPAYKWDDGNNRMMTFSCTFLGKVSRWEPS